MPTTFINELNEPIVAIAFEDLRGELGILHLDEPVALKHLDFQDEQLRIGNLHIVYDWFQAVIVCTEKILEELLQKTGKS